MNSHPLSDTVTSECKKNEIPSDTWWFLHTILFYIIERMNREAAVPELGSACTLLKYFPSWVDYHISLRAFVCPSRSLCNQKCVRSHADNLQGKGTAIKWRPSLNA